VLALALDIRRVRAADVRPLIPLEPEPAEAVHQVLDRAFDESLAVGVLDAEDELARLALPRCLPVGEEDVVHDEAGAADVQRAGRARGKADANLLEVLGDALRALGNGIGHTGWVLSLLSGRGCAAIGRCRGVSPVKYSAHGNCGRTGRECEVRRYGGHPNQSANRRRGGLLPCPARGMRGTRGPPPTASCPSRVQ